MKSKSNTNSINVSIGGDADKNTINAAQHFHQGGFINGDVNFEAEDAITDATDTPDEVALALFRTLSTKFTLEELETVCWELGIVFEDIPAKTLSGKARQLVQKADDLDVTAKLISIVNRDRPDTGIKSLEGI